MSGADSELQELRTQVETLREELKQYETVQLESNKYLQPTDPPKQTLKLSLRKTLKGHYGKIYAMDWGKDHQSMLSASQDSKLMVWNTLTENKRLAIPLNDSWVMTCAYSPDETLLASGGLDNICTLFKITEESKGWETQATWKELRRHEGYLSSSKFVDGNTIITSSGDASCVMWDIENGEASHIFKGHRSDVLDVSVWKKNGTFLSSSCDGFCKIWDYRDSKQCVGNFGDHNSDVNCVQWFPNSKTFASGSDDAMVRLFDIRAYREINSYSDEGILFPVTSLDFTRSGNYLYVGYEEDPYILCWDTVRSTVTQQFKPYKQNSVRVSCVQISPDGYGLALGSWDTFIRIWA